MAAARSSRPIPTDSAWSDKLQELLAWFESNPNLPEKIEPIVMLRFLKCVQYDVEKTKPLVELNYSMRNKHAHLFIDRNMEDEMTAKGLRVSDLLILPGLTPEGNKLLFFRMADLDPHTRNSVEETKIFFMMSDARFTMPDVELKVGEMRDLDDSDIADGDVQIVDIGGYTLRHLAYISIFVLRIYMKFLQEAYPSRLRAMHVINCPSYLDRLISMMAPFLREEVRNLVQYHTEGMDSLYKQVPKDMLPEEYGGKAGTIAELKARGIQSIKEKSGYLCDERYWKVTGLSKSRWSWF
ncbi:GL13389 [Drosophila persimilis]|uniref:Alpha-tocopherol transfer protein-like n=2 Tax=pseudoobscura subgroup TaxID=32358 RepID=B5DKF6_DROPS|nr:alpha-tocopherol transfer protein-like [Drosophila persimilis]XP_002133377.1 alpha-tocopherol transfer protein-like [Drosophila pseudoobscura]EDW30754.1 GL13389 [Drosophila persimilis]